MTKFPIEAEAFVSIEDIANHYGISDLNIEEAFELADHRSTIDWIKNKHTLGIFEMLQMLQFEGDDNPPSIEELQKQFKLIKIEFIEFDSSNPSHANAIYGTIFERII